MTDIFQALSAPFDPDEIKWRIGATNGTKDSGLPVFYVDARTVQDRLDGVLTPFGWQCRHELGHDKRITCHIGIRDMAEGDWVWKSDGAGETDTEAEKGSYSDSFKRAAVKWGVAKYLYGTKAPWVSIEETYPGSRKYKIKDSENAKLRTILATHVSEHKIIIAAGVESNKGLDDYKSYFEKLTDAEKKIVLPYHEQYKRNAQFVSQQKKAA